VSVLVACARRHGGTRGIAERIANTLRATCLQAHAEPVDAVRDLEGYDALVICGAASMLHWLR
jgi:menaquinone-dependent protoporphyrinogen oxidase